MMILRQIIVLYEIMEICLENDRDIINELFAASYPYSFHNHFYFTIVRVKRSCYTLVIVFHCHCLCIFIPLFIDYELLFWEL